MNLSRYLQGFALCAIVALTLGCNALDLTPKDKLTDKSYWSKVEDLELYANGLYDFLPGPTAWGDNTSDNFIPSSPQDLLFDNLSVSNYSWGWGWNDVYRCNYMLERVDRVKGNPDEIHRFKAEGRFFRALIYYSKIQRYGDVPWYDKSLTPADEEALMKPRDKWDVVLSHIIEDLQYAVDSLPQKNAVPSGRLHKDAAKAQLARVCLYYGTYMKYHKVSGTGAINSTALLEKAAELTKDIIASGRYEIVKGSDQGASQKPYDGYPLSYSNQFTQEDLTTNKENILARHFTMGLVTHEVGRGAGGNGTGLSKDFVESFLMKDGTPIHNEGSGYMGDEDQEHEFANRDPRIYQIIDNAHKPYLVTASGERSVNKVANVNNTEGVTGYPCVKFHSSDPKQAEAKSTSYDWFVYRYAEVLLIHAEAMAELGRCTQEVLDITINKLRDRVDMAHLSTSPVADAKPLNYGYDLDPLLYEIRRERRIELVAEDFRMDDIIRWNATQLLANPKTRLGIRITPTVEARYKAVSVTFGNDGRPVASYDGNRYLNPYPGKDINDPARVWAKGDRRWFAPLPKDQLVLNPNLTQNPGWEGVSAK